MERTLFIDILYASLNYTIDAELIIKYWRQHKSILAYLRLVRRVAVWLVIATSEFEYCARIVYVHGFKMAKTKTRPAGFETAKSNRDSPSIFTQCHQGE